MNFSKLHNLLEIDSPSGMEETIIDYLKNFKVKKFQIVNELSSDYNLTYYLDNDSEETLLIDAHVDEIGSRIKIITSKGFLLVKPFGCDAQKLQGRPAKIFSDKHNKILPGVFLIDPVHLKKNRQIFGDSLNEELLYVDAGFKSKSEAEKYLSIGDFVVPQYPIFKMGLDSKLLTSKALDNTLGVFVLLELLLYFDENDNSSNYNLIFNFSSGEEIGNMPFLGFNNVNGIGKINKIIVLDTIFAFDVPFIKKELYGDIRLGKGPVFERGGPNRGLFRELSNTADKFNIKYQNYLTDSGGSNLTYFAKYNSMTQFIGIPARNLHSPVETVHLDDISSTYNLLKKFIQL